MATTVTTSNDNNRSSSSIATVRKRRKMVPSLNVDGSTVGVEQTDKTTSANIEIETDYKKLEDTENNEITADTTPLLPVTNDAHSGNHGDNDDDDFQMKLATLENENSWSISLQVFIPYVIAGFGTVGAGMVLDIVQHWEVFDVISEIFILVPALLGLKGNLEMTLASRLSTQANLGKMDSPKEKWLMIGGNMALIQAQAIVVGFLASMAAMIFGWIPKGKFDIDHGLLLCCSSIVTASIASLILGAIMILVVLGSRQCKINPDNVATPIAASLGDVTTLSLLAAISGVLYHAIGKQVWLSPVIIVFFLALIPVFCVISAKNRYTSEVIYTGWTPVISAMVISSIGGLILDFTVENFHGIAVFQPVINGVGGNLVAVQASRLSTYLHQISKPGILPDHIPRGCPNPFKVYCHSGIHARTARVLLMMVIPGHLIFMYTISYMKAGHTSITLMFAAVYLTAALLQVFLLLFIANWMVHWMWNQGDDPDNFAIPYLTAIGDLLGTAFLAVAFQILYLVGDKDSDVGD
ncbi:solute carrier family 41 member 1-like [Tubulanus polymorphus]|uniref:solute carrier family 41 member 1-like n=1 Tax=Tubulanus polymorphus TaxID=672921 RepID=UPI003DA59113